MFETEGEVRFMGVCIDGHVHVVEEGFWPQRWFDFAAEQWAHRGPNRQAGDIRDKIETGLVDPGAERLLQQMDAAAIDNAVIFAVDWALGMDSDPAVPIEQIHRRYAEIVASNDRLFAFAGVDPRRPDAHDVVKEALDIHGFKGLKLYPPTGFFPHDEVVTPLYELCVERGVPVAVHTGATLGLLRPRFSDPLYLQDVQRRFPGITLWIAHSGSPYWWDEALAVAISGIDTYLELSSWEALAYEDERTFVKRLEGAINTLGPERLLFASDHISGERVRGLDSYRDWVTWFRELPGTAKKYDAAITDEHVELIIGGNAARCLGIDA